MHAEQRHAALADVGEAAEAVVATLELEQRAGHMRGDLAQPLGGGARGRLGLALGSDIGLHAHHAQRRTAGRPFDDAAALMQPAPVAVGSAGAVAVAVVVGLASGMAQIGLVVGVAVVGVDQRIPVLLAAAARIARVAQLLEAFVDVAQPIAGDVPLPHERTRAAQRSTHQRAAAGVARGDLGPAGGAAAQQQCSHGVGDG